MKNVAIFRFQNLNLVINENNLAFLSYFHSQVKGIKWPVIIFRNFINDTRGKFNTQVVTDSK
jgi:hypothetical protein